MTPGGWQLLRHRDRLTVSRHAQLAEMLAAGDPTEISIGWRIAQDLMACYAVCGPTGHRRGLDAPP